MAISADVKLERFGFDCKAAYLKIGSIFGNAQTISLDLLVYASAQAREASAQPIDMMRIDIPTPAGAEPFWPAIYRAVKARPEFAGAVDC